MTVDYDEINAELVSVGAGIRASECHGFISGYFCANNALAMELLQDHLIARVDDGSDLENCYTVLSQLGNAVAEGIQADDLSFSLLLPDDETDMTKRANALSEWCAGFVSGLGIGGMEDNPPLRNEIDEFIKDVVAISRMETEVDDNEETESDLFELVEYVRMGVIMLYQEWHPLKKDNERPEVLH